MASIMRDSDTRTSISPSISVFARIQSINVLPFAILFQIMFWINEKIHHRIFSRVFFFKCRRIEKSKQKLKLHCQLANDNHNTGFIDIQ